MAFDRAAALAAGYSEDEIDGYLQSQPKEKAEPVGAPPAPTTVVKEAGEGEYGPAIAAAAGAAAAAAPYVAGGGALYAGGKYLQGKNIDAKAAADVARIREQSSLANIELQREKIAERAARTNAAIKPVVPTSSPILNAQGQPFQTARPTMPTAPVPTGSVAPPPTAQQIAKMPSANLPAGPANVSPGSAAMNQMSRQLGQQAAGIPTPMPTQPGPSQWSQIGKTLGPIARGLGQVAGPVGMAASIYEAAPYLEKAQIGQNVASGKLPRDIQQAYRTANSNYAGPQLDPSAAQNVLQGGSERDIKYFGGRDSLTEMMRRKAAQKVL